jgi:hypothetical protein
LVLSLAYPAQRYLAQQSQIDELERAQRTQNSRIGALTERKERWDDPAYVRAQARKRLQYVKPGEVAYVIVGGKESSGGSPAGKNSESADSENGDEAADDASPGRASSTGTWYSKLWSGVKAADKPATAGR